MLIMEMSIRNDAGYECTYISMAQDLQLLLSYIDGYGRTDVQPINWIVHLYQRI